MWFKLHRNVSNSQVYSNDEFDLWPVYSGEQFRAFRPSCLIWQIFFWEVFGDKKDIAGFHQVIIRPQCPSFIAWINQVTNRNCSMVQESGSFRSYSRSVRSFRPDFWGESFRPSWGGSFRPYFIGGSFRPDFWGESFRPDLFIVGKRVRY